ncbi:MAG: hypothetical protein AB7O48_13390 [Cyclobacteriaceae bacterium]
MFKKKHKTLLLLLVTILVYQCQPPQKDETQTESSSGETGQIIELEPELLPTLAEKIKRDKELDSLYALIDEGILKDTEVSDELLREIDQRMVGGWGDSNFSDSVSASSFLPAQGEHTYVPKNAYDFDIQTAWVEGKEDFGIRESISFHFREFRAEEPLTSVTIYNGYHRDAKSWEQNSRVKALSVLVNGEPIAMLNLRDTMQGQKFGLRVAPQGDNPIQITFEIVDVYPGAKWKDTAITQIIFDGEWQGI